MSSASERSSIPNPGDAPIQGDLQRAVASAYVREMLTMNPVLHSPQILRRRRQIWDQGKAAEQEHDDDVNDDGEMRSAQQSVSGPAPARGQAGQNQIVQERRLRKRGWECLEQLQSEFFSLPLGQLQKYLKFIGQDRFPEFAERAARFNVLLPHRDTLLRIADKTGDQEFSDAFLESLICPAASAGPLREQYIQQIIQQRRVKPACNAIRTLVEQHPEIYQLERDWFDVLLDSKNQMEWRRHYSLTRPVASPLDTNGIRAVIGVLVIIAIAVVPALVDQKSNQSRSRTPSFRLGTQSPAGTQPSSTGRSARDHAAMLHQLGQLTKRKPAQPPSADHSAAESEFAEPVTASPPSSPLVIPPGSPLVLPPMKDWALSGTSPTADLDNAEMFPAARFDGPPALQRLPADWPMDNSDGLTDDRSIAQEWHSTNPSPLDEVIAETWRSPIEQLIRDDQAFAKRLREATPPGARPPVSWPSLLPRSVDLPRSLPRSLPPSSYSPRPDRLPPTRPTLPSSQLDRRLDRELVPDWFDSPDPFDALPGLPPGS